jgi:hypothetical protein
VIPGVLRTKVPQLIEIPTDAIPRFLGRVVTIGIEIGPRFAQGDRVRAFFRSLSRATPGAIRHSGRRRDVTFCGLEGEAY